MCIQCQEWLTILSLMEWNIRHISVDIFKVTAYFLQWLFPRGLFSENEIIVILHMSEIDCYFRPLYCFCEIACPSLYSFSGASCCTEITNRREISFWERHERRTSGDGDETSGDTEIPGTNITTGDLRESFPHCHQGI